MKQCYLARRFRRGSLLMVDTINGIIDDYMDQGYTLTVRQLYYQLVARDVIPNNVKSYNNIKSLVNDARLAGLIDWDAIEDRTRAFIRRSRWNSGSEILRAVSEQYHMDMWTGQMVRPFVLVEKEALAGVLEGVTQRYDVPLLAARGYPSVSVLREFVQKDIMPAIDGSANKRQGIIIIHLGDHDPSGIDMTRDLRERLHLLEGTERVRVKRIALTMAQIEEKRPPPNPAKDTDARFKQYADRFFPDMPLEDVQSWELDALEPAYLNELVEEWIKGAIDSPRKWKQRAGEIDEIKTRLADTATDWDRPATMRKPPKKRKKK